MTLALPLDTVGVTVMEPVETLAEYEYVHPLKVGDKVPEERVTFDNRASTGITELEVAVVVPTEFVFEMS